MSTKIELEFFSVDEKLPRESGDVLAIWSHECESKKICRMTALHYSKKHNAFNAYDRNTKEEAEMYAFQDVIAWAYHPDWSKVNV